MIASAALAPVESYMNAVLSGDIVIGELVRLAVERQVRDLERQNTEEFPYYFDHNHAAFAVELYPSLLVHTIGEFEDDPFYLEPWQAFGTACIHGWRRCSDSSRRYRRVYWSTARKNGKSCWGAGQAIQGAGFDRNPKTGKPEAVAEVTLCATKKDQAKIIYKEALRMRNKSKWLREITDDINNQITFSHSGGFIQTIGSDKPYDGLNSHVVLKDEVHAWREKHRDLYNTVTTSGGTRSHPLDMTVTTAGDNLSLIWLEEYRHAQGVLRGIFKDESTFALCYEIDEDDDPLDEAVWPKSNPNLGVSVKIEYLREKASQVHDKLSKNVFKRYYGNRSVSSAEQAISMEQWDAAKGELSDWSEADAIGGGVDLGGRDDLASWGLVARFKTGQTFKSDDGSELPVYRYEMRTQTYIAFDVERDLTKAPFAEWIHNDLIRQRSSPIHELLTDLVSECERHGVSDVAYDPAQALMFSESLEHHGIVAASMAQTMNMFTEPIQDLRNALREGRLKHDGHPVLRWAVQNAVAKSDGNDRVMYDKKTSVEKIDAIVSGTMAFRRAMVAEGRVSGSLFATGDANV